MTAPRLLLAGDEGADWRSLGRWVVGALALPGGHAEPVGVAQAAEMLQAHPAARLLYFAGRPAHALRDVAAEAQVGERLAAWSLHARAVLRLVHAHPGRCLMVDVDDAASRPEDLLAGVGDWLELAPKPVDAAPHRSQGLDALDALAAMAYIEARSDIDLLAQEWLASCIPLGPAEAASTAASAAALLDLTSLRRELSESTAALREVRAERDNLSQQHAEQTVWARALERDFQRLEEAVASLDGELARQRALHDTEQRRSAELEKDLVLHRLQVAQLLEDNDRLVDELKTTRADAEGRLAALSGELELASRTSLGLHEALRDARAAADQTRLDLSVLRDEQEALMASLLDARSEAAAAQALAADETAASVGPQAGHTGAASTQPLSVLGISLCGVRDDAPHREVAFQLAGVLTPRGERPTMDVRLVDHHGRPGLVIFGDDLHPPFAGWQHSGQEGGRAYMLVVPADAGGAGLLAPLPAADWVFLRRLSSLLVLATEEPAFGLRPAWRQIAQRLCMQLDSLPSRLRYDSLQAGLEADGSCTVRLAGVVWGTRTLPDVQLCWRPEGARGHDPGTCALAWHLPDDPDAPPPMALWPEADDGALQAAWALAVGPGFDPASRRRWWAGQPDNDRDLLLAVLDALPAAADALQRPHWRGAAVALHREARQTLRALRLRSTLRRLRRR